MLSCPCCWRPMPSTRYAWRPDTARPQVDLGCLTIRCAWQMGRVASNSAVAISNSGISPTGFNGVPNICPRNYPFSSTDPKPHYLPHTWPHLTYHGKRHQDLICHFSTMNWTVRQTDRWLMGMVCNYSLLMLYRQQRGLIMRNVTCQEIISTVLSTSNTNAYSDFFIQLLCFWLIRYSWHSGFTCLQRL